VKYAFIQKHRRLWPICVQCRVLGVSVAGYHEHLLRRHSRQLRRHLSDEALLVQIRTVYAESRGAYGWPRIWRELKRRGIRVGKQRVQQLMQQHGIRARGKRRFRVTTTQSRPGLPVAENLLNRQFAVAAPNQVWAGDITYIDTNEGWLYLAVVVDLFNRQVIGWALAEDLRQELVVDAFQMAWFRRGLTPQAGLLFHSDRGSQYAGEAFQKLLRRYQVQPSMSRKGNCWDNACSETLFGSLKVERLHGKRLETRQQAKDEVLDWLHWYNRERLHSTLKYRSPMEYEREWKQRTTQVTSEQTGSREEAVENRESSNRFPLSHRPDDEIHLLMGYGF
jgi:putative transposase